MTATNICNPMADPYNREQAAIKTLLEIRDIATQIENTEILQRIDGLFNRCGHTLITPTQE